MVALGLQAVAVASTVASPSLPMPLPPMKQLHDPIGSVQGLITRLLGAHYVPLFQLEVISEDPASGRDVFELGVSNVTGTIIIRGNTGVALASGLNWYLKYSCNASVSWGRDGSGNNLRLPSPLPQPAAALRMVTPNDIRYLYNVCTAGYSTPFWSFAQWQAEIDRMALFGVSAPLAFAGQEYVMLNFLRGLGLNTSTVLAWMSGPAFLPWFRMNNMRTWPVNTITEDWITAQRDLQLQILAAQRAFGMTPMLAGWSGRVPAEIAGVVPGVRLFQLPSWAGMNASYSSNFAVDPTDAHFVSLGVAYTQAMMGVYGTDHLWQVRHFAKWYSRTRNVQLSESVPCLPLLVSTARVVRVDCGRLTDCALSLHGPVMLCLSPRLPRLCLCPYPYSWPWPCRRTSSTR